MRFEEAGLDPAEPSLVARFHPRRGNRPTSSDRRLRWACMTLKEWLTAGVVCAVAAIGLSVWGIFEEWRAETALAVAGLAVSVAGFALALLSIHRAKSVSEATQKAVTRTLKGVAAMRLGAAVTDLRHTAADLEEAAARDDGDGARRSLNRWRQLGGSAQALVKLRFGDAHEALVPLKRSISSARRTKADMYEGSKSLRDATASSHDAMEKALDQLEPLVEELLPTITDSEESDDGNA